MHKTGLNCEHCGERFVQPNRYVIISLDKPIASADAGEPAVICKECAVATGNWKKEWE